MCFEVHGFSENGNDYNKLLVMFNFLEYKCDINTPSRIGQLNNKKDKMRPIKVELKLASNASAIHNRAKNFRYEGY